METLSIQPNRFVVLDYTLRNDDGDLLDASEGLEGAEPIAYVHGYGMLVPGLEAALAELAVGDERNVVVAAEEGYGEYDEELVLEIERSEFPNPAEVTIGDEFLATSPDGEELPMRVIQLTDDSVVVDANHPLAGMTLHYAVKVREVRPATDEEIARAANELDECGEHGHDGCCCGHDHDHAHDDVTVETPDILSLSVAKKKPN